MTVWYSTQHNEHDTPLPWNIEEKIRIFEDRVKNWTINKARQFRGDTDAGYAMLSLVLSYFEMIGLYLAGATEDIQAFLEKRRNNEPSRQRFEEGVRSVAEHFNGWPKQQELEKAIDRLYRALRCGLYHSGMARYGVWVEWSKPTAMRFARDELIISPEALVDNVYTHFDSYIETLLRPQTEKDSELRNHFEKRFDLDVTRKMEEIHTKGALLG